MLTPEKIAEILKLQPLEQEGGLFRRTYETQQSYQGHPMGTAIYFLLSAKAYSHLHRLPSDEVYHFYMGDPVELYCIHPDGEVDVIILGTDLLAGQVPQAVIPAGCWQGSKVKAGGRFALLGTTMSPGFHESDYEHATDIQKLKEAYPKAADAIDKLTGETVYL